MNRREYLITGCSIVVMPVAGCTSDTDNSGDTGNSNGEAKTEASLTSPTLESHDVQPMTGGYEMVVTMTNTTESVLIRAVGEVAIYNDNTRLANGRAAVIDLEPGVTDNESALLEDFSPDDVTHYTITMSGETEDYEETKSEEVGFGGDEFRDRLSG